LYTRLFRSPSNPVAASRKSQNSKRPNPNKIPIRNLETIKPQAGCLQSLVRRADARLVREQARSRFAEITKFQTAKPQKNPNPQSRNDQTAGRLLAGAGWLSEWTRRARASSEPLRGNHKIPNGQTSKKSQSAIERKSTRLN